MNHILVISSNDLETYQDLFKNTDLSQATAHFSDGSDAELAKRCNIWFGSPSLIAPLLAQSIVPEWIQSTWAGVEPLLQAEMPTSYTLTNMRGIFNRLIAEYAVGHIFSHELNVKSHLSSHAEKRWNPIAPRLVKGKTAGILGVGEIGGEIARLCKAVGMNVWGYTRSSTDCEAVDRYFHGDQLGECVAGADYLISIMPNTAASTNLLNKDVFTKMKPTALLINAGRGTAIVDDDLLWALRSGEIGGAVLDVFRQEPLPADNRFWDEPNLLVTSHTAAPTLPADAVQIFVENYERFAAGGPLKFVVDFARGY